VYLPSAFSFKQKVYLGNNKILSNDSNLSNFPIHFQTTYPLSHQYDPIKARAPEILGNFFKDPTIYRFNDKEKTLIFTSERLKAGEVTYGLVTRPEIGLKLLLGFRIGNWRGEASDNDALNLDY